MRSFFIACCGVAVFSSTFGVNAQSVNWSGIILGVQAGYGTGHGDPWTMISDTRNGAGGSLNDAAPGETYNGSFNLDGAFGGINIGYNHQTGYWVWGGELVLNIAGIDDTYRSTIRAADDAMTTDVEFFLTAAAKVGYAMNNTLIYAKGGYSGGSVETLLVDTVGTAGRWSDVEWHNGYMVGAGVDHALSNGIIIGLEYNFIDLGSATHATINVPPGGPITPGAGAVRTDVNFHTIGAKFSIPLDKLFGN